MADIAEGKAEASQNARLCGHERQQNFLEQQLASGRLHHALLFEGEEGIGKADFAFHFAYFLLAGGFGEWRDINPESLVWRQMEQGTHPGLLYISRGFDAKSGNMRTSVTVDDVRRVSKFLQQTSADRQWRIVIIDPADDMNRNAANALLKTLEEPPAKTLFILISHNMGRLLPTIRSRCQSLRFKLLSDEELRAALASVSAASGNKISDEIIALAEGNPRRALALMETGGADHAKTLDNLVRSPVFPVPQAQKLAEILAKRDNAESYALFLDYILEFLHKKACSAAKKGRGAQADAFAAFCLEQAEKNREAAAFNLDKKQFILVLLQKLHSFLYNDARVSGDSL